MDPVTKVLLERARRRPRLLPWVIVAVSLHAGAAAATYLVGRRAASRPVQLPVVAVKVVRPERQQQRAPSRQPGPQATPIPRPTEPPPTAVPEPTAAPTIPPAEPEKPRASADAMPAARSAATPAPTPPPQPAGGGGRGLSIGESNDQGTPGIPSDFHFAYYVERMLALIESRWYKPAVPSGTRARVRYRILRDGRLEEIRLEESSGIPSFDRAALRAMYAANPLPPLPPGYGKDSLTVHLSFAE